MRLLDYLLDRAVAVLCLLAAAFLIGGLLWLVAVPTVFIVFAEGILVAAFIVALGWDYWRRRQYYQKLFMLLEQLDEQTLIMEIAEQPGFLDGRIVADILRRNHKFMNDKAAAMDNAQREYREFIETWVHEIKTPITSARLVVENDKNPTTLKIDDALRQIEQLVELVLYDARATEAEKDFKVEHTSLRALVNAALRPYAKPIIQADGQLQLALDDTPLVCDVKSCVFVIGQILANAIKYRREHFTLTLSAETTSDAVVLKIHDNGIGIAPEEVPRVFDKGFTGSNGRQFPRATGMGLYLSKRLCDQMNVGLDIESQRGEGTTVRLIFPQSAPLAKRA